MGLERAVAPAAVAVSVASPKTRIAEKMIMVMTTLVVMTTAMLMTTGMIMVMEMITPAAAKAKAPSTKAAATLTHLSPDMVGPWKTES
ncbi:hypothetical protein SAMN05444414_11269 [Roseovarius marisflavi]|uniref:Uncharacterized protein n=1 Tax=Roseovarius marisflavi TaxID=1054996 RepID=A0A1M7A686_9RHOB|nr:hypothetical protein SAMN05444414_11269 [Roseovarius marisflavi]